jgi:hypothetical protein
MVSDQLTRALGQARDVVGLAVLRIHDVEVLVPGPPRPGLPAGEGDGNMLFSLPVVRFLIEMLESSLSSSPRDTTTTCTSVLSLAKSGPMLV